MDSFVAINADTGARETALPLQLSVLASVPAALRPHKDTFVIHDLSGEETVTTRDRSTKVLSSIRSEAVYPNGLETLALFDWAPMDGGIVGLWDIGDSSGSTYREYSSFAASTEGLGFLPFGDQLPAADPRRLFYTLTLHPYLTTIGNSVFVLDPGPDGTSDLVRFDLSASATSRAAGVVSPKRFPLSNEYGRIPIVKHQRGRHGATEATLLAKALESSAAPVGLFSESGSLYLLSKMPAKGSDYATAWRLNLLDARSGRSLAHADLPTSAPNITLIPGPSKWAILEKERAQGDGDLYSLFMRTTHLVSLRLSDLTWKEPL